MKAHCSTLNVLLLLLLFQFSLFARRCSTYLGSDSFIHSSSSSSSFFFSIFLDIYIYIFTSLIKLYLYFINFR
jgi:hypothetical protein